jgi:hypothetical protein
MEVVAIWSEYFLPIGVIAVTPWRIHAPVIAIALWVVAPDSGV